MAIERFAERVNPVGAMGEPLGFERSRDVALGRVRRRPDLGRDEVKRLAHQAGG